jgi:hypothetical protein
MPDFTIVDVIPRTHSNETQQDSEPSIAVNPANPDLIVISAFTRLDPALDPLQTKGLLYVSLDGGYNWDIIYVIPGGRPLDQTYKFSGSGNEFYGADINGGTSFPPFIIDLNALSIYSLFPGVTPAPATILESETPTDQPFIAAVAVMQGSPLFPGGAPPLYPLGPTWPYDPGKGFYIGYNDFRGWTSQTSAIDICLDLWPSSPTFNTVHLDQRTTSGQDGPQVRTAVHPDGTIYAVFTGWRAAIHNLNDTKNITTDIVVVRDDNWGIGPNPFTALIDPIDSKSGFRLQTGVTFTFSSGIAQIGQQRIIGDLSIAVDPRDSDILYVCWAGKGPSGYTLHVQKSTNRGVSGSWSADLLTVPNAINPALAVSSAGRVGFLYQQLTGIAPNDRWETHFQDSADGVSWQDHILATTPAETPPIATTTDLLGNTIQHQPYLGDYIDLVAVGKNFYGTFCANNTPDPANFPSTPAWASTNGAIFLRNVTPWAPWNLLGTDHVTPVSVSIDPFFFKAIELPAYFDFYVRHWTNTPSNADNGAEPCTNPIFFVTPDVWNQTTSNTPFPPNANDQPTHPDSSARVGPAGVNYAFARIRRNALPPAGSGPTTVSAHFLVSEFGTGSNFIDWIYSDPTDPDVTFPVASNVTVTFADTDLGPKITPSYEWDLAPTTSDHLCLAVEISAPGSPFSAPGLTGRAPGAPGAALTVLNDNHKSLRNLQVYPAMTGTRGSSYYAIVHNAATFTRDMALQILDVTGTQHLEGAMIEIITPPGVVDRYPWKPWDRIILPAMQPGENRWVGVTVPVPTSTEQPITAAFVELKGQGAVNGFAVAAKPAPLDEVIASNLVFHRKVLTRLESAFHIEAARKALRSLDEFDEEEEEEEDTRFNFEENVVVTAKHLRIEVEVRVSQQREREDEESLEGTPKSMRLSQYHGLLKKQVRFMQTCLSELLKQSNAADAFSIQVNISNLSSITSDDGAALVTEHATLLHKFDAYMTMLQKSQGDRADILQNVVWQMDLYDRSTRLNGLPDAAPMRHKLENFVKKSDERTLVLSDYGTLLKDLAPGLRHTANALLGTGVDLHPLINLLEAAKTARSQQKAHRDFLLQLQAVAS